MTMPRRVVRRGGFRRPGRRPKFDWARTLATGQTTIAANTFGILASVSLFATVTDVTVYRTVGRLWVQSDQSASVENQLGAMAMIVVNDNAFAAGAASILDPVADANDDAWFFYMPFMQSSDLGGDAPTGYSYQFDSRRRVKIDQGQTLAVMIGNASASNGLQVSLGCSWLGRVA